MNINDLPFECLVQIIKNLPEKEQNNTSLVNKVFYSATLEAKMETLPSLEKKFNPIKYAKLENTILFSRIKNLSQLHSDMAKEGNVKIVCLLQLQQAVNAWANRWTNYTNKLTQKI